MPAPTPCQQGYVQCYRATKLASRPATATGWLRTSRKFGLQQSVLAWRVLISHAIVLLVASCALVVSCTYSKAVKSWIEERNAKSAVVVGGGFIGIEMVENLVARGLKTTLVEVQSQVCPESKKIGSLAPLLTHSLETRASPMHKY